MAGLLISLFGAIGSMLCVLPGLFVMFIYMLTFLYMTDKNLDFWPAMEASRQTVMANIGAWIIIFLVMIGLNILGGLACGIGQIVSAPVSLLMLALAYLQVEQGGAPEAVSQENTGA